MTNETKFADWELVRALEAAQIQPPQSGYWDTGSGQDDLEALRAIEAGEVPSEQLADAKHHVQRQLAEEAAMVALEGRWGS